MYWLIQRYKEELENLKQVSIIGFIIFIRVSFTTTKLWDGYAFESIFRLV